MAGGWGWCGFRVLCWLRGDPEGIRVVRVLRGLLEAQGVVIVLPEPNSSVVCDVVVLGVEGRVLKVTTRGSGVVEDPDAWRALFKALSHPTGFSYLRIGVDPGATCSLAAYADNLLVWAEKLGCGDVGRRVKWLIGVVEPRRYVVNIGSGSGLEELMESLLGENVEFNVVPEETTTVKPVHSKIKDYVRDEDILAAMTIALIH